MRLRIRGKYGARWLHLDHSPANDVYVSPECLISSILIRDSLDIPRPWNLKTAVLIRAGLNISFIEHRETIIRILTRGVDAYTAQDWSTNTHVRIHVYVDALRCTECVPQISDRVCFHAAHSQKSYAP